MQHEALARLARQPVVVAARGLRIGGVLQVFAFEQTPQRRFAAEACRVPGDLLNIGYGLGFAQAEFLSHRGRRVHLVELSPRLAKVAERSLRPEDSVVRNAWQAIVPRRVPEGIKVVYFDAFPVEADFDYSPTAFRRYLAPFIFAAALIPGLRAAFMVAFDKGPLWLPRPVGWQVRRVLSFPLPDRARSRFASRISLYKLSRAGQP